MQASFFVFLCVLFFIFLLFYFDTICVCLKDNENVDSIDKLNKLIKIGKNEHKEERELFVKVLNSLQSANTHDISNYTSEELYTINKNGEIGIYKNGIFFTVKKFY